MNLKFNKFERVAGVFVLLALSGGLFFTFTVAVKKGWFSPKVPFATVVDSADGLHEGTPIHVSGLRAGQVKSVRLVSNNEVHVDFEVFERFKDYLKEDSEARVLRPFVLGDKVIEISMGSEEAKPLKPGDVIVSHPSFDVMDLVSGKTLGPFLGTMEGLMTNLSTLAEAFADPKRTETFIRMFDRVDPLIVNMNEMSLQVTRLTRDLNHIIPEMRKKSPELGEHMAELVERLNTLTGAVAPAFDEVGPDLPRVSRRAVEALDEMVITLKAMQRSFMLSGRVRDVRQEEEELNRQPAQTDED